VKSIPRVGLMPKTVLVADDSLVARRRLCQLFEAEAEYDLCAQAANGREAIELAKAHMPDLIIMDFAMPVMNGLEAARELKRIMPEIPIILFTLHADELMRTSAKLTVEMILSKSDPNLMKHVRTLIPDRK
jgi:CheY-like chemotaxis protein